MTMHKEDWAKLWMPLAVELVKSLFGLIFGTEKQKRRVVEKYSGKGKEYEDAIDSSDTGDHYSGYGFKW